MNANAASRLANRLLKEHLPGWIAWCREYLDTDATLQGRPALAIPNQALLLSKSAFRDFTRDEARRVILDEIARWKENHKPN